MLINFLYLDLCFVSGKIMNGEGDSEQKVQGAPVTDQTLPNLVSYMLISRRTFLKDHI